MHSQESNGHNGRDSQDPAGLRRPAGRVRASFVRGERAVGRGSRGRSVAGSVSVVGWVCAGVPSCVLSCLRSCVRFVAYESRPVRYLSLSLHVRAGDCVASARRGLPLGRKLYSRSFFVGLFARVLSWVEILRDSQRSLLAARVARVSRLLVLAGSCQCHAGLIMCSCARCFSARAQSNQHACALWSTTT